VPASTTHVASSSTWRSWSRPGTASENGSSHPRRGGEDWSRPGRPARCRLPGTRLRRAPGFDGCRCKGIPPAARWVYAIVLPSEDYAPYAVLRRTSEGSPPVKLGETNQSYSGNMSSLAWVSLMLCPEAVSTPTRARKLHRKMQRALRVGDARDLNIYTVGMGRRACLVTRPSSITKDQSQPGACPAVGRRGRG
jgi:hypothetical protein